ncbi:MAG: tRPR [Gammaproteobacteria bacterium]|nr:tRPR [Gammaproteobacteria bacterium]
MKKAEIAEDIENKYIAQYQDGWNAFMKLCLTAKNSDALSSVFEIFLTPEEKKDIATRCLIVKDLLEEQKTQREMAKDLKVSIAKITRGSNELKRQDEKLIHYLKRFLCSAP